ncbi:MAG: hypothetical protein JST28_14950 [Acidobacteria bacterium]|nr:hypothetical protein [Acidobacteriota bacterium]
MTQNITVQEITATLWAVPAFIPVFVCTGYLAGWCSNVLGFRQRSLVERLFWSIPLSFSVSAIFAVLVGKFFSLSAASFLILATLPLCLALLVWEWSQNRRSGQHLNIGLRPLGLTALLIALLWIALVVVTLVDIQKGTNLYASLFSLDHSARVAWTASALRTGVPPDNPLYYFRHPAPLRNYYFWYVVCAVVSRFSGLPARAVMTASCAWSGFALVAVIGLYLKHFLHAGARLRKQVLIAIGLLCVTGLDICANAVDILMLHKPLTMDLEWWSVESIYSWYSSLFWVPHHVAGLVCCFFAFLLAWNSLSRPSPNSRATFTTNVVLIGAALASSFGYSIFVTFGFFLVMLAWAAWQLLIERNSPRPVVTIAAGGLLSLVLLVPYLFELTHNQANPGGGSVSGGSSAAGHLFTLAVREMIPPEPLLQREPLRSVAIAHPQSARNLAKLILLVPSYIIEFGFYLVVLLIYLIPSWRADRRPGRDRTPLTPAHRTLLFIVLVTLPIISFVRSTVLKGNDFGWRAAMILQLPLLLLASELIATWGAKRRTAVAPPPLRRPLHALLQLTMLIGLISTASNIFMVRFAFPLLESGYRGKNSPLAGTLGHNAYISWLGYDHLDRAIPPNAIVQFAPLEPGQLQSSIQAEDVNHQVAVQFDSDGCGAGAGGDPSGCPAMLAALVPLFQDATAQQALEACREHQIQYLVANIYDPVWKHPDSWVWKLNPVVADPEFRALDCR